LTAYTSQAVQSVILAWDANPEPNIAGYVLHYGNTQGQPTENLEVGNATSATVSKLADGTTYFFTVTARNTFGLESAPSNEVSYRTPEKGAHELRVINGTGSGSYTEGAYIRVSANSPEAGQRFHGWTRDWLVLTNPFIDTTTALMLSRDLTIEATYSAITENDEIRYYPRGGIFRPHGGRRI
jgi:Fibronectin type III domain/Divergent InlB B-repeat domain